MKFTHTGILEGCDSRTRDGLTIKVRLRETKLYWITENKDKYRKSLGWCVEDWPLYKLNIESIKPIGD